MHELETLAVKVNAANVTRDATGSNVYELVGKGSNGYLEEVVFQSKGANTIAVGRVFLNVADPITLGENNFLIKEVLLPATSASETAAIVVATAAIDKYISEGQRILVTVSGGITDGYDVNVPKAPHYNFFNV